jgi:4a-hydroxytetrahydrobiopterin dehydratase
MSTPQKLSDDELRAALEGLEGWSIEAGKLHREFKFKDFTAAFGFMTQIAIEANSMWHHPELYNVWNRVVVDLVTHEADDSISDLDVKLAAKIDELARA